MPTIYSWNVNGVRAAVRNGLLDWIEREQPDILCIQETKACLGDLTPAITAPKGYGSLWRAAKKRGYSGVATYFRREPLSEIDMGIEEFDSEGRVQLLEYPEFTLINAYFPNSQPERKRLDYKLGFCSAMLDLCERLRAQGKNVVVCGDINIAHEEIDLARPKTNADSPGFYIEERECMTRFLDAGYVDGFRHFVKDPGHYTWWSYRAGARKNNVGWRIDYHLVNRELAPRLKSSAIHCEILGSDHCPVSLTLKK
jgi:exodeoxyribonuclease-3